VTPRRLTLLLAVLVVAIPAANSHATTTSCRRSAPTTTTDPPSAKLLATIGTLRRPATALDVLPNNAFLFGVDGVEVNYVRLARRLDGVDYFLVPAERQSFLPVPASCLHKLPHREQMILRRIKRETDQHPAEQLDLVPFSRDPGSAQARPSDSSSFTTTVLFNGACGGGGDADSLDRLPSFATCSADRDISEVVGIVPDGVASIEASYGRRTRENRHRVYRTALRRKARVTNNVVIFHVPRRAEDAFPSALEWIAADGTVVRRFRHLF
jgi:hypothetical protein